MKSENRRKKTMMKNYFEEARTLEDVKQIYKKLARELHPDCNPDKDTTKEFQTMQHNPVPWLRLA